MRAAYYEVLRNVTFRAIQRETRMSDRQVAMLRWSQIRGNTIACSRQRSCNVSREVIDALALFPRNDPESDFVFIRQSSLSISELNNMREQQRAKEAAKKRFLISWPRFSHKRVDRTSQVRYY